MTPQERDRLRAAWLTGGLAPEERQGLLQEAARDQALFDELVDAEPVRELLAEPETRAEALRRLRSAAPAAAPPWWRQRWSWAGAGALALAGLFLLVVVPRKQAPVEAPVQLAATRPAAPPAPEPAAPAPAASVPLQLNRAQRDAGGSGSIDSQPGRPGDLRAEKPKAAPAARSNEELPEAVRTERDAKGLDELRAAAPAESAAFREKKAERADARDRPGGVAGGVVGGIIGGVPAPSPPPPPPPAAEVAASRPAPQARQEQERFGQRAAGGPMQSAPVQQSVATQQQKEGLARKVVVESALADAAQTVAKSAGASVSAPFKATLGLRQPDGAIRSVPPGGPVDRGAPLVLTIEAAEQGVVQVAGLPGRTPPSRNLAPGEKWVLDLPTADPGVRTLRVGAGALGAAPVAGFAASNRIAAPLSISYQVR